MEYYDWDRTLSYQAPVTMVVGMRGVGKTYGLRLRCWMDYLKDGSRCVEICRYKSDIAPVMDGYMDRLAQDSHMCGWLWRRSADTIEVAREAEDGGKPIWDTYCYFTALTQMQRGKKKTYNRVKRLVMDEAVLERGDRYHHYLPREWVLLANVVDSCTRQGYDGGGPSPHLYLLGNSCDLLNPAFAANGIDRVPPYGYSWHNRKTFLLHYAEPEKGAAEAKLANTLAGRMVDGTAGALDMAYNLFHDIHGDFIASKTPEARCAYGIAYAGDTYGIWVDERDGMVYVDSKVPADCRIYSLTRDDARINRLAVSKTHILLKDITWYYGQGILRYSTPAIAESFGAVLAWCGVR